MAKPAFGITLQQTGGTPSNLDIKPCRLRHRALGGIPGEALSGIMGEIELLRGLNHPNIVKYIGSFKTRSHLYIIMEVGS